MSKSRRFELVEGASSKFWSIEIEALLRFERFEALRDVRLVGGIEDEDALVAMVEQHARALGALAAFALPLSDDVSSECDGAIRALLPNVVDLSGDRSAVLPSHYASWR